MQRKERTVDYDRVARGVASRLAVNINEKKWIEQHGDPDRAEGERRNPVLDEALRHEKAIDAILDEPAEWWTGSFAEDPNEPHKVLKSLDEPQSPLGQLSPGCAYCCRPAGDDGLCGECRYEHGE